MVQEEKDGIRKKENQLRNFMPAQKYGLDLESDIGMVQPKTAGSNTWPLRFQQKVPATNGRNQLIQRHMRS